MKNQSAVELGKKGAETRWTYRPQVIKELSKYYDKSTQNSLLKWPTKYLVALVDYIKLVKKVKNDENYKSCTCRKCGITIECIHNSNQPHILGICGDCAQ